MKNITRKAIVIAIIAGLLVLCDGIITSLLKLEGSFTWIAFVSWTVFFGATTKERFKAVAGYIVGFLAAIASMKLGGLLSGIIPVNIFGVALGTILATFIINFVCIELENAEKNFPYSVSGIFVGIAMTFSGLGVSMSPNTISTALIMLTIIVVYGILGLLSGWGSIKFGMPKQEK